MIKIAICSDKHNWSEIIFNTLKKEIDAEIFAIFQFNIESDDWIENLNKFDVFIWNPLYMGVELSSHFKEKIYFIQEVLGKLVIPNFSTIWHFESKVAQSYIFRSQKIHTPETFVSFDYYDALEKINKTNLPIVFKKSSGAASRNVKLGINQKSNLCYLEKTFCNQLWNNHRINTTKIEFIIKNFYKFWFGYQILYFLGFKNISEGVIYWQEFIPNNSSDLRITVIGNCFAYGFWRKNRFNDFRASGSGLIDYYSEVPREVLLYCLEINDRLNFDSMCYDILFTGETFKICEMSYSYIDKALYNAPGYYFKDDKNNIEFITEHTWPQELWARWSIKKTIEKFS